MKLFKFFFYKMYSFSLSNGEDNSTWAFAIVSMFMMANIYFFLDIALIITKSDLPEASNMLIILICGILFYLNYLFLIKNGKAKQIVKEFNEMRSTTWLNIFLGLYVIVSIVLFIYMGNMVRNSNYK